jgi:hypothetical protein
MKDKTKKKKIIRTVVSIIVLIILLIILLFILCFNYLTGVFGPSPISTKEDVLSQLGEGYEVIGSVHYEYEYSSTNCRPTPYLIRKWKVKNIETDEMHEVYECVDISGTLENGQLQLDSNGECVRKVCFK